mgnify:CR=1 FL=1
MALNIMAEQYCLKRGRERESRFNADRQTVVASIKQTDRQHKMQQWSSQRRQCTTHWSRSIIKFIWYRRDCVVLTVYDKRTLNTLTEEELREGLLHAALSPGFSTTTITVIIDDQWWWCTEEHRGLHCSVLEVLWVCEFAWEVDAGGQGKERKNEKQSCWFLSSVRACGHFLSTEQTAGFHCCCLTAVRQLPTTVRQTDKLTYWLV